MISRGRKADKISLLCIIALLISSSAGFSLAAEDRTTAGFPKYPDYLESENGDFPVSDFRIDAADFEDTSSGPAADKYEHEGEIIVEISEIGSTVDYIVDISKEGYYNLALRYFNSNIKATEIGIRINDEYPFRSSGEIKLQTVYKNSTNDFQTDRNGNELTPDQVIDERFIEFKLCGDEYSKDGYYYYLEEGENRITVELNAGILLLAEIRVFNDPLPEPYATPENEDPNEAVSLILEGEKASRKSGSGLYPTYDRSSPMTSPNSSINILLNTIGGNSTFSKNRQWVEWDFDIEKEGTYSILMRFRQNLAIGISSYRRIYIDGEVQSLELDAYRFKYSSKWQLSPLNINGEMLKFCFSQGRHTIRLETVPGESEYTVSVLDKEIAALNDIYRQIILITGAIPDLSRDYFLEEQIPGLLSLLSTSSKNLIDEFDRVMQINKGLGSDLTFLKTFSEFLDSLVERPSNIPARFYNFKTNIATLSALRWDLQENPLEIDWLMIRTDSAQTPKRDANIFAYISFEILRFLNSFINDYDLIGGDEEKPVEISVWTTAGREPAQIMKNLITNHFSSTRNISVKLSLLPGGSIIEPIMANKAPDIVIGVGRNLPVNLAARGALSKMNDFDGFSLVMDRFPSNAAVPYTYEGNIYAIPETQDFNMCFIRTDVFAELGLTRPRTWDDLRMILPEIIQNNLEAGIPNGIQAGVNAGMEGLLPTVLPALVMQKQLSYYNDDMTETVFSTKAGVDVFLEFTKLYKDYSCTVYFNAMNRFRTGEMPFMISSLSSYNALKLIAPEINGLWEIYEVLGTVGADGTTDHTEEDQGTASIIIGSSEQKEAAFDFIEWWSSTEVQSSYAQSLENMLGPSARYMTANLDAFDSLGFSRSEHDLISSQRSWLEPLPELPASYIITRNLSNAFLEVVKDNRNPISSINQYAKVMKDEMTRKKEQLERLKK